ncbi:MAG: c-type cytochrome [Verrucomicrobia bacterium]|nr:c-type cytochrome [Verrucomicrobiota bacterium]
MKTTLLLLLISFNLCASEFPVPYNSEPDKSEPMPPAEAAAKMKLPPGFKATVFAAEPDVQNPIAMAWDARGRLWVAENYTYAERSKKFDLNLRDRIVIFEDKDGDGRFDTRKVFTDELQMLTSIEVGHGGVWVMCPPQVLFIPDRNGDDVPDAAPEVVLDGFTIPPENYHNFANGLRFGPDGWLYGRCGASSPGEIGAPGTPAEQRIPMRGTMWRYHPQRKTVEALSGGCTNPWGHDWNEHGELFFINTVNGQLWHDFAGAHFVRPHTIDPNPRAYELIDQHADHWHFDVAEGWSRSRGDKAETLGGGHAHIGMMIYLGDNWPTEYRGHLFTLNMHGLRANQEILERSGSGYVGRHGKDFFFASDPWFRGMELSYGPDGGVFALDWSDTGECHDSTGVHRTSGRIYKITYGEPKRSAAGDIAKLSASELVKLHTHANEWFSRQARLELVARAQDARGVAGAKEQLRELFETHSDVVVKLRALWSLYSIGAADEAFLRAQLRHSNEHVRTWAVRLLSDTWPLDTTMSQRPVGKSEIQNRKSEMERNLVSTEKEFARLARTDSSGLVRLALASTLQRLPVSQRAELAAPLLTHKEDANDHNLPLLIWYGLIPVADTDPTALAGLAAKTELPITRKLFARRLAEDIEKNPAPLNQLVKLSVAKPAAFQTDILNGIAEGLAGWHKATKPAGWDALAAKLSDSVEAVLRDRARDLSVLFGDGRALDAVKTVALDQRADLSARKAALQTLIDNRAPDLRQLCEQLVGVQFLNSVAARGLASFDDPAVGVKLVRSYRQFHPSERGQLLSALVSRATFANALLDAVAEKKIPREDISAFHARQMRSLNNAALNKKLADVWGELRDSSADKQQLIARWKTQFTPVVLGKADKSQGRVVFNTACAACHTLYSEGGKVGPDLTGGGRDNLDYLLENIVDPSAVVTADFRMSVVELKDGRVLNGLIAAKTERTLTLKTMTETLTIERSEITAIRESPLSLMPEGLLEALTAEQARDLVAYLMHKAQVPMPVAGKYSSH